MLVGFHGYAEDAAIHLEALERIPGARGWLIVSVQALHPFYARQQQVVASWMTSQQREYAIADNVHYVGHVVAEVRRTHPTTRPIVFSGFSQGGAMAYRAAAAFDCDGILVLAADVPPDVAASETPLPRVLIGCGTEDRWYSDEQLERDLATLRGRSVSVDTCVFTGGHEWSDAFYDAAGRWLAQVRSA